LITLFLSETFNWSTPAVVDGMLYVGGTNYKNSQKTGLIAIKLVEGGKFTHIRQSAWIFPVKTTLEASGGWIGVASSPVVADGVIYFGGLDGVMYAISASVE
jgi:outer membrane protein assembly factor BamB